jgi:hypothetical protein
MLSAIPEFTCSLRRRAKSRSGLMATSLSRRQPPALRRRARSRSGLRGFAPGYCVRREHRTYRRLKTSYCLFVRGTPGQKFRPPSRWSGSPPALPPDRNIRRISHCVCRLPPARHSQNCNQGEGQHLSLRATNDGAGGAILSASQVSVGTLPTPLR